MAKYTSFSSSKVIKCSHNIIDFSTPIVMGILNLSSNSFFDGGKYNTNEKILRQCKKMIQEGAKIIDIGAHSSKPGSSPISEKQEILKIIPTVILIKQNFPEIILSVDTFRSNTAKESVKKGADIINDISAGELDDRMFRTIADLQIPYIIMHMEGIPSNMQKNPNYKNVLVEVFNYLKKKIKKLKDKGVRDIIIDPGFGFGKTISHNYTLLNNLNFFQKLNCPILVGISRKSMIYKVLDGSSKDALHGTSVAHTIALQNGANILRVHDVSEAIECIKIVNFGKNQD